jgi:phosphatidylinositol alpha-1,6-mannosyltransferase
MRYVPELRYVIVGPDAECGSALRETVRALKLGDHVRFTGQVDPVDLPRYYSLCDVFVMANLETEDTRDTEGFGIVFLEASASGKPVIGGRAGGAAEAVKDGVTGLLVDSLDTLSLAQSMTRLLTDDTLARRLGAQGREWVMRNFDWDQTAEKVREAGLTVAAGREEGVQ